MGANQDDEGGESVSEPSVRLFELLPVAASGPSSALDLFLLLKNPLSTCSVTLVPHLRQGGRGWRWAVGAGGKGWAVLQDFPGLSQALWALQHHSLSPNSCFMETWNPLPFFFSCLGSADRQEGGEVSDAHVAVHLHCTVTQQSRSSVDSLTLWLLVTLSVHPICGGGACG